MKKIAVWGPNRWCNFGDDLQSVVFALHLRSLGYEPVVFQLAESIAEEHQFVVAHTVDELLKDVRLCIIAGGALLTPGDPLRRMFHKGFRHYARDFRDLHRGAKKHGTRFCAISMGGDGKTRNRWLWYDIARNRFFSSNFFLDGTVRLEGDVAQMKTFGKKFEYIPDCLFSLNRFVDIAVAEEKKAGDPVRVGFNLQERHVSSKFLRDIHDYAASHSDMKFYFASTHMDKVIFDAGVKYEYLPEQDTDNIKFVHYHTPSQLLRFIADTDVFITSKLHLGLVGLLAGTPFISYRGMGKARTFLKSINGQEAILDDDATFHSLVAPDGLLRKSKAELMRLYDLNALQRMVDESWEQYEFCSRVVAQYA